MAPLHVPRQRLRRLVGQLCAGAAPAAPAAAVSEPAPAEYFLKSQYQQRMRELALPAPAPPFHAEYHTAAGLARAPVLDWAKVMAQFDAAEFMRDGVAVLKGIFTVEAAARRGRLTCYHSASTPRYVSCYHARLII